MRELIVGEIEGRRARLARARSKPGGGFEVADEKRFSLGEARSFEEHVGEYLSASTAEVREAALAVGGPIEGKHARPTKESFVVSARQLQRQHNFARVTLMNDCVAAARGAVETPPDAFSHIIPGDGDPGSAIVVASPGVGLGMATVRMINGRWRAFESEGGHQAFAPADVDEMALWQEQISAKHYVSFEDIVSEAGVLEAYRALSRVSGSPPALQNFAAVVEAARDRSSRAAVKACQIVARSLATFAGNACLAAGARGGVILGGSVARALEPFLMEEGFLNRFRRRGAMTLYVADVPVRLMRDDMAVLRGLAAHCLEDEPA
ncbi:MAG TPA: glucokinase [Caulobacterales bacterium]|nr:glucokinase [Caulobacterales bacterium]